jgi:hypothetical protein
VLAFTINHVAEPCCAATKLLPSFLIIFHSDEKEVDEGTAFIIREPWATTKQLQKLGY